MRRPVDVSPKKKRKKKKKMVVIAKVYFKWKRLILVYIETDGHV